MTLNIQSKLLVKLKKKTIARSVAFGICICQKQALTKSLYIDLIRL